MATGRSRSYLFALVHGGGTVPPELGAARRLVKRGHHVEVLAENSMIDEVRATGAIFRPWVLANNRPAGGPEHDPLHDWQCRTPAQLFTRLLDRLLAGPARQYAADVISAVDAHPPNRVVCSMFAVGAMVGAEAACIPYDVLMPNIYLLPARGCRRSDSAGSRRPARLAGSATWLSPSPFSANGTRAATASTSSVSRTVGGLLLRADLGWRVCPRWIRRGWRSAVRARAMGWPLPWPSWPGTAARSRLRCRCWCIPCSTTGQRRGKGSTTGQRRGKGSTTRAIGCGTRPATGSAGRHTLAAPILMSQSRPVTRT